VFTLFEANDTLRIFGSKYAEQRIKRAIGPPIRGSPNRDHFSIEKPIRRASQQQAKKLDREAGK
jgi:hypothetical protein